MPPINHEGTIVSPVTQPSFSITGKPYLYAEQLHPTAWVGRKAVEWIKRSRSSQQPFFLKVSLLAHIAAPDAEGEG